MYKPKSYGLPSHIPPRDYQGYIWDCQSERPTKLPTEEAINFGQFDVFPFILEGLLYHKSDTGEFSLIIRYTDRYHIYEYDLNQLPSEALLEPYAYIAHRMNSIKQLQFQQLWLPEREEEEKKDGEGLCLNMPVLRLRARLFTGFIPNQKT